MFSYPRRLRVTLDCSDSENMTKQSHKEECDINNILTQFKRTGIIQHITQQQPIFTDLPDQMDYQQALHLQEQATEAFASLPSTVRRYFENNPAKLLNALGDPEQTSMLQELGILARPEQPQPPGNPLNHAANQAGVNSGSALLQPQPSLPLAPAPAPASES